MFVSMEVIAMIGVGATLLIAYVASTGWLISRMDVIGSRLDAKIDATGAHIDAKIDATAAHLDAKIERSDAKTDAFSAAVDARLTAIDHDLVEIKVAVARMEGPRPRFATGR